MTALRTALATVAASSLLLHCATPSTGSERAQQLSSDSAAEFQDNPNSMQGAQTRENAAAERGPMAGRPDSDEVLRVSDARARLHQDYMGVVSATNARLADFKMRLDALSRRTDARAPRMQDNVAAAKNVTGAVQAELGNAGERTAAQWEGFKANLSKKLDAAEVSVGEAERAVAMR